MVKVSKVAVWKIGNEYIEDATRAAQAVRRMVIEELLRERQVREPMSIEQISEFVSTNYDQIETRVKSAMAGA